MSNRSSRGRKLKKTEKGEGYERIKKQARVSTPSAIGSINSPTTKSGNSSILTPTDDLPRLQLYETPLNLSNLQVFSPFPYTPSDDNRGIITPGTNSFLGKMLNDCEL